ncbi:unnamed protein product [Parajaminaea phylloscopi]
MSNQDEGARGIWGVTQKSIAATQIAELVANNNQLFTQHPDLSPWAHNIKSHLKRMLVSSLLLEFQGTYPGDDGPPVQDGNSPPKTTRSAAKPKTPAKPRAPRAKKVKAKIEASPKVVAEEEAPPSSNDEELPRKKPSVAELGTALYSS